MTTLAGLLAESAADAGLFASAYLKYLGQLLATLDVREITGFIERLEAARRDDRTIFLIGNGGSAATASHMANDLGMCARDVTGKGIRALALTDGTPLMTAIANDHGYDGIFSRQLEIHYRPGDILVAISASGNSPNLLSAARWVKARGGSVMGLLGFDGGELKSLCDWAVLVRTPKGEYGPVEDTHMVLDHLVMTWFSRDRLRPS